MRKYDVYLSTVLLSQYLSKKNTLSHIFIIPFNVKKNWKNNFKIWKKIVEEKSLLEFKSKVRKTVLVYYEYYNLCIKYQSYLKFNDITVEFDENITMEGRDLFIY